MLLGHGNRISSYKRDKLIVAIRCDEFSGNIKDYSKNVNDLSTDGTITYRVSLGMDGRWYLAVDSTTGMINLYEAPLVNQFDATKGTIIAHGVLTDALWADENTYKLIQVSQGSGTNEVLIYKTNNGDQLGFRWAYNSNLITRTINITNPTTHPFAIAVSWDTTAGKMYAWAKFSSRAIQTASSIDIGAWTNTTLSTTRCLFGGSELSSTSVKWPYRLHYAAIWNECFVDADIRILSVFRGA